jgi:hypothetical protein
MPRLCPLPYARTCKQMSRWIDFARESGQIRGGPYSSTSALDPRLEVAIIFTTVPGTTAALEAAGKLAQGLNAKLRLLVPQVVPYQFPLTRPPVDLDHARRAALALLTGLCLSEHMTIQICLCRSRQECWNRAVPAGSLVLVGGRRSWWAKSERRLAERIRSLGHEVIFVSQKRERPCLTRFTSS